MKESRAVEKVIERVYKDRLVRTGSLPSSKETREIERKVRQAAENSENRSKRGVH